LTPSSQHPLYFLLKTPRAPITTLFPYTTLFRSGEVNLDPNGSDFRSIAGVTNTIPNPNEPQPKSDEWSLTLERELMWNMAVRATDRKSTRLNSSHRTISYAVFCLKKKKSTKSIC